MRQGERLLRLAARLGAGGTVTIGMICEEYGVSLATAKRDFVILEQALPVTREPIPGNDSPCPPKQLRMDSYARFVTSGPSERTNGDA